MNYGIKRAIAGTRRGFRKAGQALEDFDNNYSNAVYRAIAGDPTTEAGQDQTRQTIANYLSAPLKPPSVEFEEGDGLKEQLIGRATQIAAPIAGFTTRYALPATGVALAGKGVMDIATGTAFGGGGDQQSQGELQM